MARLNLAQCIAVNTLLLACTCPNSVGEAVTVQRLSGDAKTFYVEPLAWVRLRGEDAWGEAGGGG